MTLLRQLILAIIVTSIYASPTSLAQWQSHVVRQLNGNAESFQIPAQLQIVGESWNRVVVVPYLVQMPEKNQLLMLVGCDYPHRTFVMSSNDNGATWTDPHPTRVDADGKPSVSLGTGLAYLGKGRLLFYELGTAGPDKANRWFSSDYGETWGHPVPFAPLSDGHRLHLWDPPLVDRHPETGEVIRLAETGYTQSGKNSQAYIRFSTDKGQKWTEPIKVPQWHGVNEVVLSRTGNNDLLAACRTEIPARMTDKTLDHYAGLGTCISKDNGRTWSEVQKLFDFGRHHPSLILMPDQDVVMTYVVRLGYVDDDDGLPQFGIEAVVSHDHGETWDLDHRYLLHVWSGKRKGKTYWWPSSQSTSSTLLADGSILTAFGTGFRIEAGPDSPQAPRDVGLIKWRLGINPINSDSTVRDAPIDSDIRNVFDPK